MSSKLTYASLPIELKKIANESLGLGVLKSLFSYNRTYFLMIKVSDGIFIGFALYHFENSTVGDRTLVTGVMDAVVVAPAYRKEGFGTLLTFGVLRKMSAHGADRVEIMLKVPSSVDPDSTPGVPLIGSEEVLAALGFSLVREYHGYYTNKSAKYSYDCRFCGDRPDSCVGLLYAITERGTSDIRS